MNVTTMALTLSGTAGRAVVVTLAIVAVFALVTAVLLVFTRERRDMEGRLTAYDDRKAVATHEQAGGPVQLAETKIIQDAVGMTSRLAQRSGVLEKVEAALERAEVPVRAAEALFFYAAGVVLVFLLVSVALGNPIVGLIAAAVGAAIPAVMVDVRGRKRLHAFEAQLPDTLKLLSGSLRAGFSFLQGVDAVAKEATEPTKKELARVFTEARLGRPIEDALDDAAARMQSRDLAWAVMAIRIQREVGGNLAELLETVAETMSERDRLRREISALTAEGRMSAIVLAIFPPGFAALLYVVKPNYISTLFDDGIGIAAVVAASVLAVAGFAWLRKIVAIEV
jgi:tight adherence protein B